MTTSADDYNEEELVQDWLALTETDRAIISKWIDGDGPLNNLTDLGSLYILKYHAE